MDQLLDLPGALRALRRRADVSQRQLAASSGVPAATIGRLEAGAATDPKLRTVERLVRAAGARLAIVDVDGTEPASLSIDAYRDAGDRRYPAHLDPRPQTRWRRRAWHDVISFVRNRDLRDMNRRDRTGMRRSDLDIEFRRLGPRDADLLAMLHTNAAELDLAGSSGRHSSAPSQREALRYLRDPTVRHWIAEATGSKRPVRVLGHLAAHVQRRRIGLPTIVVTEIGVHREHRDAMIGPLLAAALCDEAAALGAGEIVALADDPAAASYLCSLGFIRRPKRPLLLTLS
jgi:transcriptional regulator with XRE-family HTH domain/N-acetylglutamate synthase-like GNAT family acetyltransferase